MSVRRPTIAIWMYTLVGEVLSKCFSALLLSNSIFMEAVRHRSYLAEIPLKRLFLSFGEGLGDHLLLGAIEPRFEPSRHLIDHSSRMLVSLDALPVIRHSSVCFDWARHV